MTRMIERNTTIPTRRSEIFSTAVDNQPSVEVHVLQGEREMAAGNKSLGRFHLTDLPPAPRGVPQIEVIFGIDANGIVHVTAKDTATGKEQSITITGQSAASREDIDRMIRDAEAHAEDDRHRREEAELRNNADALVYATEKLLAEQQATGPDRDQVQAALAEVETALQGGEPAALRAAVDRLQQASTAFGERLRSDASGGAADSGVGGSDVVDAGVLEEPSRS
jgi:molecular chaperone DnaK